MEKLEYFLTEYPPPSPPERDPEILSSKDFSKTDDRVSKCPPELVHDFEKLMTSILEGTTSDLDKVRAIFAWLSCQTVVNRAFPKVPRPNTPLAWLKKIKLDRTFYVDLFTIMCRKAQVPCVIVEGASKGAGFEVGKAELKWINRWNAVHIQGSWQLINAPWALVTTDGIAEGEWLEVERDGVAVRNEEVSKKEVKHEVDEFWFLTKPENFAAFFHPKDSRWQLLESPWSEQDFLETPRFSQDYFESEWELVTDLKGLLIAREGTCKIGFVHPTSDIEVATLNYNLYFNVKQSPKPLSEDLQLERYVVVDSKRGEKSLVFRLPQEGVYRVEVAGQLNDTVTPMAEFRIECPPFTRKSAPFPEGCKEIGYTERAADLGLDNPTHEEGIVQAKPGEKVQIGFRFAKDKPKPRDVRATITHYSMPSEELGKHAEIQKNEDGLTVTVHVPDDKTNDEFGVCIDVLTDALPDDSAGLEMDYTNAINYIITQDSHLAFPKEKEIMKQTSDLLASIKNNDLLSFNQLYPSMKDINPVLRSKIEIFLKEVNKIKVQKLQELLQAMSGWDINSLEETLKYYEALRGVNQDIIRQARAVLGLLKALKADNCDVHRLEESLKTAFQTGLRNNCNLQKAEDTLVALLTKDLSDAYFTRNQSSLTTALKAVSQSCVKDRVHQEHMFVKAEELLKHLKDMKVITDQVGSMKSKDLKKMAGPANREPHPHVRSVLMATFILLGEKEADLWTWSVIQNLLERRGEQGVAKAMAEINVGALDTKRVALAEGHVRSCQYEVVRAEDPNTAVFLKWVNGVVKEKRDRDSLKQYQTDFSLRN